MALVKEPVKKQNVRVVVASERPEAQYLLRGVVEEGGKAVVVGQAQDAPTALILTRNLRPDVTIVDCFLPYVVGLDSNYLSRIGGLDIAQTIQEEMPRAKVILLTNLDTVLKAARGPATIPNATYSLQSKGAEATAVLANDMLETTAQNNPIFASVVAQPEAASVTEVSSLGEKAMFYGGLTIGVGWLLTVTIIFAPAGVAVVAAGAVTFLFGLSVKTAGSLWRKLRGTKVQ